MTHSTAGRAVGSVTGGAMFVWLNGGRCAGRATNVKGDSAGARGACDYVALLACV